MIKYDHLPVYSVNSVIEKIETESDMRGKLLKYMFQIFICNSQILLQNKNENKKVNSSSLYGCLSLYH